MWVHLWFYCQIQVLESVCAKGIEWESVCVRQREKETRSECSLQYTAELVSEKQKKVGRWGGGCWLFLLNLTCGPDQCMCVCVWETSPGACACVCVCVGASTQAWVHASRSMCLRVPRNERAHWLPRGAGREGRWRGGEGGGKDERMEEEDDDTGGEIEQRTELRPGSGEKLSSFHFHFPFISLRAEPCVGAFHTDGVPKFRSGTRWRSPVGK